MDILRWYGPANTAMLCAISLILDMDSSHTAIVFILMELPGITSDIYISWVYLNNVKILDK